MQTESNVVTQIGKRWALTGFLLALSGFNVPAFAADPMAALATPPLVAPPSAPLAPAAAAPGVPMPASAMSASNSIPMPVQPPVTPASVAPASSNMFETPKIPGAPATVDDKKDKNLETITTKLPDSVRDVVKRLDTTSAITLEDLNSARQAVARIDALIEIEKHITELEKVRQEREEGSTSKATKAIAAAIPQSAIAPPPIFPSAPPVMSASFRNENPQPMMAFNSVQPDITRISGSDGHYTAMIKSSDSLTKSFRVGDRLPSGGTIEKITASEVVVNQDGAKKILHVKNVDMVFSDKP